MNTIIAPRITNEAKELAQMILDKHGDKPINSRDSRTFFQSVIDGTATEGHAEAFRNEMRGLIGRGVDTPHIHACEKLGEGVVALHKRELLRSSFQVSCGKNWLEIGAPINSEEDRKSRKPFTKRLKAAIMDDMKAAIRNLIAATNRATIEEGKIDLECITNSVMNILEDLDQSAKPEAEE